uniref:Aminotransferase-like plant mobile domain-containing protein n=1 Tax=Fagus sylvatica TaxID=28930 RepID=A0A2N9FLS0_FAGSY
MRHWWTLLGEDDHADIVGIFGKFPPFMRLQLIVACSRLLLLSGTRPIVAFPLGRWILFPTLEEYAELLQLDSPFSETPVIPIQGPRSNRCLEKYLGLTTAVLRPEIARPEETWRKANISLDLLTKYFSRRDRERGFRCSALSSFSFGSAVTCSISTASRLPYHFERHTVTWGPAVWRPWTHCALFDGVPLPGVWGCTGYYPSLALRQFGGVQYPPRLGDLDAVTFDYIPGEDMWRLLSRIEVIWEGRLSEVVLIEEGSPGDSSVTSDFVEWREGWTPFFTLRPTVRPGAPYSFDISLSFGFQPPLSPCGVPCITTVWRWRTFAATWRLREGNVSTLRTMNEFIREQLEISEDAKDQLEETLAETREQLETEQAERTRVQDELDSLRSYTQALVDPATGRPQDIVALRRALDASEEALTSARTSMGVMRVQISVLQGDNGVFAD